MARIDNKRIISAFALVSMTLALKHDDDVLNVVSTVDEWEQVSFNDNCISKDISSNQDSVHTFKEKTRHNINSNLTEESGILSSIAFESEDNDFDFCSFSEEFVERENQTDVIDEGISSINPVTEKKSAIKPTKSSFNVSQLDPKMQEEIYYASDLISNLLIKVTGDKLIFEKSYEEKLELFKEQLLAWNKIGDRYAIVKKIEEYDFYTTEWLFIIKLAYENKQQLYNINEAGKLLIAKINKYSKDRLCFLSERLGCNYEYLTHKYLNKKLTTDFLETLDIDEIIMTIETILVTRFKFPHKDTNNIMERIFKFIDKKPKLIITPERLSRIMGSILTSKRPECFEQVYLTFKMWGVITHKMQIELMDLISRYKSKIPREIFIMLYLFSSKSSDNLMNENVYNKWFELSYTAIYPDAQLYDSETLERVLIYPGPMAIELTEIANNFDGSLIYLPKVLNKINGRISFENNIVGCLIDRLKDAKYTSHVVMGLIKHYEDSNQEVFKHE